MENETVAPLVKKTRCPKGQIKNKQGDCVAKKEKVIKSPNKTKKNPIVKARKTVKVKPPSQSKSQMTKAQAAKILIQRKKCIERFRNK
jgi:hypothetical protein